MAKFEAVHHPEEAELVWTMLNHAATQRVGESAPAASDEPAEAGVTAQASGVAITPIRLEVAACVTDASEEPRNAPGSRRAELPLPPTDAEIGGKGASAESREVIVSTSRRGVTVLHQQADATSERSTGPTR